MADSEPSYIDYEAFLDPSFSPSSFANTLVTSTNNPSDTPLDLSTPLSRVLFDIQEIDTHIHTLTTKSALPLLTHTRDQTDAGQRVLEAVEGQVSALREGYKRLEKDVLERWESAEEVRGAAERSWATVRLARAVGRCLVLGRQLEGQMLELTGRPIGAGPGSGGSLVVEDHRALVRASNTLLMLRRMFITTEDGEESYGLDRVKVIRTLRSDLIAPAESAVKARAAQIINKFSLSSLAMDMSGVGSGVGGSGSQLQASGTSTFAQAEDAKSRITSAITALYLLSPTPHTSILASEFQPELLLATLKGYIHTCLTSSLASLSRSLSMLPTLDRTLQEISAKCQNIMALEALLETIKPPAHPFLHYDYPTLPIDSETTARSTPSIKTKNNLLQPLLQCLDTPSLPSYFWRSLASSLTTRVQEIVNRGGVSTRTLRSNRERLREQLRECVLRGSQLPNNSISRLGGSTGPIVVGNWEREAAVMVSAVVGVLGR
ncbi:hypothetical protein EMCG_08765 [[Emmonsia] crescens]|uniref:Conserved oligomeric Golgi complex subunit 5 n=1 Tax=[Emmonsia] crescens TaxID=73230 RepID=A0A0G2I567_9EURO|nr:hypothetical protein EMCG_08765 [Emmonsia crescens UAMH 3008]